MTPLALGIDLGTSGARAVAMTEHFEVVGQGAAALEDFSDNPRDPHIWWAAVSDAVSQVLAAVDAKRIRAIAADATSGTVLPVDGHGNPLAAPLMYNDRVADNALLARIAPSIPAESAAHGATSGLAKALVFQALSGVARILHQADWIAGQFTGRLDITDENNALKTGYDPVSRCWPDWMAATGLTMNLLPSVVPAGTPTGGVSRTAAARFGLAADTIVVAGTTDGCASFLATGADTPGDGVSALGSTLTLKLLSDRPVFSAEFGIYSHRINDLWLAGGASNSGGKVLSQFFDGAALATLSEAIDPTVETDLDYYPLPGPGERFPVMDAAYPPRMLPRPASDAAFLHGLLEGIARVERLGYARLGELGAPRLRSVRSVGGGAANPTWTAIRRRALGVPFETPFSHEAAAGAARLALKGLQSLREAA